MKSDAPTRPARSPTLTSQLIFLSTCWFLNVIDTFSSLMPELTVLAPDAAPPAFPFPLPFPLAWFRMMPSGSAVAVATTAGVGAGTGSSSTACGWAIVGTLSTTAKWNPTDFAGAVDGVPAVYCAVCGCIRTCRIENLLQFRVHR